MTGESSGEIRGWSWVLETDDTELPMTSVRVRYRARSRWRLAVSVRPDGAGGLRVRRRFAARRTPAARYLSTDTTAALLALPGFEVAVGDSYSDDSTPFLRSDAIRVASRRALTDDDDIDRLVHAAVGWAEHLRSLGLLDAAPRPTP